MPKSPDALRTSLAKAAAKAASGSLQGSSVGQSSNIVIRTETASFATAAEFRASPLLAHGTVFEFIDRLWKYDSTATGDDDGTTCLKPNALTSGQPGRGKVIVGNTFGPFPTIAAFRAATPPSVLTSYVIDGVGTCVYRPTDGAGVADNGVTIFKPTSVDVANPGRGYLSSLASTAVDGTPAAVTRIVPPPNAVVTGGNLALNGDDQNTLIAALYAAVGNKLSDIFIGDVIRTGDTLSSPWPSSAGRIFPLTHAGASAAYSICRDPYTGRKGICDPVSGQTRSLRSTSTDVCKAVIAVFRTYGSTGASGIVAFTGGHFPIWQADGTKTLYTDAAHGSPVHHIDDAVHSELLDMHCIYSEDATNTTTGVWAAGYNSNYSMFGELYALITLTSALTSAEITAATAAVHRYYGIRKNDLVIFDGHSIAYGHIDDAGSGSAGYFPWHAMTVPRLCGFANHAHSGDTLTVIQSGLAAHLASHSISGFRRVLYFLDGDTNSYRAEAWTGDQVVSANWAIADAARAAGCKVILSSCMRFDAVAAPPGNAAKTAGWNAHADAYCDLFGQNIELVANLHPSKNGYMKYARTVREVILSLLA